MTSMTDVIDLMLGPAETTFQSDMRYGFAVVFVIFILLIIFEMMHTVIRR